MWEARYREISRRFRFSPRSERLAPAVLSSLLGEDYVRFDCLEEMFRGARVAVVGPMWLGRGPDADVLMVPDEVASKRHLRPDVVLTDLDGDFRALKEAEMRGAVIGIHAHGDNIPSLRRFVPAFRRRFGTCQCNPRENVYLFGGFTDGDRCAFMAAALGAARVDIYGFDFSSPIPKRGKSRARKALKLMYARLLLRDLRALGYDVRVHPSSQER